MTFLIQAGILALIIIVLVKLTQPKKKNNVRKRK